jgi:hypothetical protein
VIALILDFDGVLHPADVRVHDTPPRLRLHAPGHELFEHNRHLEELIAPYPELSLVLSTTWAWRFGLEYARNQLPPALQSRVVGTTFDPEHPAYHRLAYWSRYAQIASYIARRGLTSWLAVDDDALGWPSTERHRLLLTPADEGLGAEAVRREFAARLAELCRT